MSNKIQITKYDKPRAKWYFALFKFLELFAIFLFTFGFYGLGSLVYKHFPTIYSFFTMYGGSNYFLMWFVGFLIFLTAVLALLVTAGILCLVYSIIKAWIKGNWNLAKGCTEDKTVKAKRLKQQELEDKRADRKKWGYCVGDEVRITGKSIIAGEEHTGDGGTIVRIDGDGNSKINFGKHSHWYSKHNFKFGKHSHWYSKHNFKITKKQNLGVANKKLAGKNLKWV